MECGGEVGGRREDALRRFGQAVTVQLFRSKSVAILSHYAAIFLDESTLQELRAELKVDVDDRPLDFLPERLCLGE